MRIDCDLRTAMVSLGLNASRAHHIGRDRLEVRNDGVGGFESLLRHVPRRLNQLAAANAS